MNRAHGYGFDFERYISTWNDSGLFVIQIESIEAVENIDALVAIEGVDAVMIGPYDISGSLDVPGETNHPKVREVGRRIVDACERAGMSCMTQIADVTPDAVQDAFDQLYIYCDGIRPFILWKWAAAMAGIMEKHR